MKDFNPHNVLIVLSWYRQGWHNQLLSIAAVNSDNTNILNNY